MIRARIDLTKEEARTLARLCQRGFDDIEDDYGGSERWSGRAESLRVLATVRRAAYGDGWERMAVTR